MKFTRFSAVAIALVAVVMLAGCTPYMKSAGPHLIQQSDQTVLEAISVVTTDPFGHDLTVQRGRECEVAEKDADGKVTKTKNCKGVYVEKQGGPNVGQVVVDSAIEAVAVIGAAATLGATMPKTKISTGGASATGGKASSGSQSTGALTGSGAAATITVQNP